MDNKMQVIFAKYSPILIFLGGIIMSLYSIGPAISYPINAYGYATINNGANSTTSYYNSTGSYVTVPTSQYNQMEVGRHVWLAALAIIALISSIIVIESGRKLSKAINKRLGLISMISSLISFGMLWLLYNDISIIIMGFILTLIGGMLSFLYS